MNPEPTAYLVEGPDVPSALWHARTLEGPVNGVIHPLFKRDDIAPLRVPLIDQSGTFVGFEHRRPDELLSEEVYRDEDGTIWQRPTAFAYAAACTALHAKRNRVERLEATMAQILDGYLDWGDAEEILKEGRS